MERSGESYQWIGAGFYTIAETAYLTGISSDRIRRWMKGYSFSRHGEIRKSPPVVHGEHATDEDGHIAVSFRDLTEVRFVHAFLEAGVTWKNLRIAHAQAAELLHSDHPFATRKFFTDGHTVLIKTRERNILDIVGNQLGFARILEHYITGVIDFERDAPIRWWPMGRHQPVVIDALRSFGQPIISTEGVPTAVLYRAYLAENRSNGSSNKNHLDAQSPNAVAVHHVASWFGVEKRSVRAAVEYELRLAA